MLPTDPERSGSEMGFTARGFLPRYRIGGDFVIRPGWTLGPRTIRDYELVYFPSGSRTRYQIADQTFALAGPCLILTPPGIEHAYIFDSDQPIRHQFIHFMLDQDGDAPLPHDHPIRSIPAHVPADRAPLVVQLVASALALAAAQPDRWRSRCAALLQVAIDELAASAALPARYDQRSVPAAGLPPQIIRALAHIDEHLETELSIPALAAGAGWTHEYFTRVFTAAVGLPPKQEVIRRRIDRACEYLLLEASSVKEIAFRVGFRNEAYFCRAFKRWKGVRPSEYRERYADPRLHRLYLAPAVAPEKRAHPLNVYLGD